MPPEPLTGENLAHATAKLKAYRCQHTHRQLGLRTPARHRHGFHAQAESRSDDARAAGTMPAGSFLQAVVLGLERHHAEIVSLKGDSYPLKGKDLGATPAAAGLTGCASHRLMSRWLRSQMVPRFNRRRWSFRPCLTADSIYVPTGRATIPRRGDRHVEPVLRRRVSERTAPMQKVHSRLSIVRSSFPVTSPLVMTRDRTACLLVHIDDAVDVAAQRMGGRYSANAVTGEFRPLFVLFA